MLFQFFFDGARSVIQVIRVMYGNQAPPVVGKTGARTVKKGQFILIQAEHHQGIPELIVHRKKPFMEDVAFNHG